MLYYNCRLNCSWLAAEASHLKLQPYPCIGPDAMKHRWHRGRLAARPFLTAAGLNSKAGELSDDLADGKQKLLQAAWIAAHEDASAHLVRSRIPAPAM
jgi:hypothetical protein